MVDRSFRGGRKERERKEGFFLLQLAGSNELFYEARREERRDSWRLMGDH